MNLKSKLTSRKFWVTLISLLTGIAQLFGADGDVVSTVSGIALSLIPVVIYVISEGRIDAAAAGNGTTDTADEKADPTQNAE